MMDTFLLIFLSAVCFFYIFASTAIGWSFLSQDFFHPAFYYRFLISVTLVAPVISTAEKEKWFSDTGVIVLITALFFLIAIDVVRLAFPKFPNRLCRYRSDGFLEKAFLIIFWLGWAWRTYALNAGLLYGTFLATQLDVNEFGNLFALLNGFSLIGLFGYFIFAKSDSPSRLSFLLIGLELLWALISGSKIALVYVVAPVLLIGFRRGWIKLSFPFVLKSILVGIMAIQISFLVVTGYRVGVHKAVAGGQGLELSAILDGIAEVTTEIFDDRNNSKARSDDSEIAERLNWASYYGALVEREDLWRFGWLGESYIPIFTWWIPRVLWPEKPAVSIGVWYGEAVLGWEYESRSEGAITIWGDALVNFGIAGAFGISFLWILFSYSVYHGLSALGSWGLLALSTVYVRLALGLEQNMANPVVAIQQQLLIIWIIYWALKLFKFLVKRRQ